MASFDLIIRNGQCVLPSGIEKTDIGVKAGRIARIGVLSNQSATREIDAHNLFVLPGVIDTQVHFREPGLEHKENFDSGSRAAVLGGVVGFFDMPNTTPATTTRELLHDKVKRAENHSWCDFGFYIGATQQNISQLAELEKEKGCCGIKVFMGSSTGDLLINDDQTLEDILKSGKSRIAFHAEDESRLQERKPLIPKEASAEWHPNWRDEETAFIATQKIVLMAEKYGRKIHILHVSSKAEIEFLADHKKCTTVECLPQYLFFSAPEVYRSLGTLAQMNPPIRSQEHQLALWKAIENNTIDIIATDHAPHTLEEKAKPYPHSPSGMPGVQTLVPVMLNFVNQKKVSLEKVSHLLSTAPAKHFGIQGFGSIENGNYASLTLVDLNKEQEVLESGLASRCGWSPFTGHRLKGWPVGTIIRGQIAMWQNELMSRPKSQVFDFQHHH